MPSCSKCEKSVYVPDDMDFDEDVDLCNSCTEDKLSKLMEIVLLTKDLISEEYGWGTYSRMEGESLYNEAHVLQTKINEVLNDRTN